MVTCTWRVSLCPPPTHTHTWEWKTTLHRLQSKGWTIWYHGGGGLEDWRRVVIFFTPACLRFFSPWYLLATFFRSFFRMSRFFFQANLGCFNTFVAIFVALVLAHFITHRFISRKWNKWYITTPVWFLKETSQTVLCNVIMTTVPSM